MGGGDRLFHLLPQRLLDIRRQFIPRQVEQCGLKSPKHVKRHLVQVRRLDALIRLHHTKLCHHPGCGCPPRQAIHCSWDPCFSSSHLHVSGSARVTGEKGFSLIYSQIGIHSHYNEDRYSGISLVRLLFHQYPHETK